MTHCQHIADLATNYSTPIDRFGLNIPNGIPHYINHYGDCVGYPEEKFFNVEHELGTGYYPYGDLPDVLDAYEGGEENYWNTG